MFILNQIIGCMTFQLFFNKFGLHLVAICIYLMFQKLRQLFLQFEGDSLVLILLHMQIPLLDNYMSCLRDFYDCEIGCPTLKRFYSPSTQHKFSN